MTTGGARQRSTSFKQEAEVLECSLEKMSKKNKNKKERKNLIPSSSEDDEKTVLYMKPQGLKSYKEEHGGHAPPPKHITEAIGSCGIKEPNASATEPQEDIRQQGQVKRKRGKICSAAKDRKVSSAPGLCPRNTNKQFVRHTSHCDEVTKKRKSSEMKRPASAHVSQTEKSGRDSSSSRKDVSESSTKKERHYKTAVYRLEKEKGKDGKNTCPPDSLSQDRKSGAGKSTVVTTEGSNISERGSSKPHGTHSVGPTTPDEPKSCTSKGSLGKSSHRSPIKTASSREARSPTKTASSREARSPTKTASSREARSPTKTASSREARSSTKAASSREARSPTKTASSREARSPRSLSSDLKEQRRTLVKRRSRPEEKSTEDGNISERGSSKPHGTHSVGPTTPNEPKSSTSKGSASKSSHRSHTKTASSREARSPTKTASSREARNPTKMALSREARIPTKTASSKEARSPTKMASSREPRSPTKTASSREARSPTKTASSREARSPTKTASSREASSPTKAASSREARSPRSLSRDLKEQRRKLVKRRSRPEEKSTEGANISERGSSKPHGTHSVGPTIPSEPKNSTSKGSPSKSSHRSPTETASSREARSPTNTASSREARSPINTASSREARSPRSLSSDLKEQRRTLVKRRSSPEEMSNSVMDNNIMKPTVTQNLLQPSSLAEELREKRRKLVRRRSQEEREVASKTRSKLGGRQDSRVTPEITNSSTATKNTTSEKSTHVSKHVTPNQGNVTELSKTVKSTSAQVPPTKPMLPLNFTIPKKKKTAAVTGDIWDDNDNGGTDTKPIVSVSTKPMYSKAQLGSKLMVPRKIGIELLSRWSPVNRTKEACGPVPDFSSSTSATPFPPLRQPVHESAVDNSLVQTKASASETTEIYDNNGTELGSKLTAPRMVGIELLNRSLVNRIKEACGPIPDLSSSTSATPSPPPRGPEQESAVDDSLVQTQASASETTDIYDNDQEMQLVEELHLARSERKLEVNVVEIYGELTCMDIDPPEEGATDVFSKETIQQELIVVLDTNVLLSHLDFVKKMRSHGLGGLGFPAVLIPWVVLQELDSLKNGKRLSTSVAHLAIPAVHYIYTCLKSQEPRLWGQSMQQASQSSYGLTAENNDDRVLQCCLQFQDLYPGGAVVLCTNDKNLCSKALLSGVKALSKADLVKEVERFRPGLHSPLVFQTPNGPHSPTHTHTQTPTHTHTQTHTQTPARNQSCTQTQTSLQRTSPCLRPIKGTGGNDRRARDREKQANGQTGEEERKRRSAAAAEAQELSICLAVLEECLKGALSQILEVEMKAAYGDLWTEIVYLKPPWTLADLLQCLKKHWIAVFGNIVPRGLLKAVEHLSDFLNSGRTVERSSATVALCESRDLLKAFRCRSNCSAHLSHALSSLDSLLERMLSQPESAPGENHDCDDDAPMAVGGEEEKQATPPQASHQEVWSLFEHVWTNVCQISSAVFTALHFDPGAMETSQLGEGPPAAQDVLACLHKLSSTVTHLLQGFSRVLSPDSGPDDSHALLTLILSSEIATIETRFTAKDLMDCLSQQEYREKLHVGGTQLAQLSASLERCVEVEARRTNHITWP